MSLGSVVVIKIIKKIDTTIEMVEETSAKTETAIKKLDRPNDGTSQNVLEPSQALSFS